MKADAVRWQQALLWGGLLEPGGGRRTLRDWIIDGIMFVGAVASGTFVLAATWDRHSPLTIVLDVVLGLAACAVLWLRRRRPLGVASVAVGASAVSALAAMATVPAVFNAAIRLPLRQLTGVMALAVTSTAILPLLYPEIDGRGYAWQLTVGLLLTAVALGWGLFVRAQRELLRGLRERAEHEARHAERRRIAREMHDVLAHRLSILGVHAGALENAPDTVPPPYRETARIVRGSAVLALEELRQVIGLLRDEPAAGGRGEPEPPQPTLEDIPALVDESRAAGLEVVYRSDVRATVPDIAGRTAYRAVQEGLTNARKHGGEQRVDLTIAAGDAPPLTVEVVSHGIKNGAATLPGAGTGLVGLAERIELAGGELVYGADEDGRFTLRATVPWTP